MTSGPYDDDDDADDTYLSKKGRRRSRSPKHSERSSRAPGAVDWHTGTSDSSEPAFVKKAMLQQAVARGFPSLFSAAAHDGGHPARYPGGRHRRSNAVAPVPRAARGGRSLPTRRRRPSRSQRRRRAGRCRECDVYTGVTTAFILGGPPASGRARDRLTASRRRRKPEVGLRWRCCRRRSSSSTSTTGPDRPC